MDGIRPLGRVDFLNIDNPERDCFRLLLVPGIRRALQADRAIQRFVCASQAGETRG
jgi:hypothetical protein